MAETEHVYTIPLRVVKSVPRWRRTNRAMTEVRDYLSKHMKTPAENVKIDKSLNEALWARGDEKPSQAESSSPDWFRVWANRSYR